MFTGNKAAWQDEDDQNVTIRTDTSARTKKLRLTPQEDVEITGVDYADRLAKM